MGHAAETSDRTARAAAADAEWWKRTTIYQIYPRSFRDTNGDGIGDLRGILERLDYLEDLGVETLWICPFYDSPQRDFGYDIRDHLRIDPSLGSEADLQELIDAVHARRMKVVFDIVLNHTSDQHPWFQASKSDRNHPQRDYYLWRDGKKSHGRAPPNNWRSVLGNSGWHYDPSSDQWYFASFLPFQPDLNYRNPEVKRRMLEVVRHWLGAGADGLRLDLFHVLYKDASFADNPFSLRALPSFEQLEGFFQNPIHTQHHADTVQFAKELRALVDDFEAPCRFLLGELFGDSRTLRRYCGERNEGLHFVFLFKALNTPFSARAFRALIEDYEAHYPDPLQPTWVFGNHDQLRVYERLGRHMAKAKLIATLQLTARGVPVIYYGDELGLPHMELPRQGALDPVAHRFGFVPRWLDPLLLRQGILLNRDSSRAPMPWTADENSGFSPPNGASPWLPLHPASAELNVARQRAAPDSLLNWYRLLLRLRRARASLHAGRLQLAPEQGARDVVVYQRTICEGGREETTHVALNFGGRASEVKLASSARLVCSSLGTARLRDRTLRLAGYEAAIAESLD